MKKGRNWKSLTKFAKKNKSWMFTTFNILGLKALTTQTWVMKPNCSSFGPCSSPTGHCWRGWQSSGKILVSEFNFLISIFKFNLIIWFPIKTWLPQRFPRRRSQNWFPRDGNSRSAKPHVRTIIQGSQWIDINDHWSIIGSFCTNGRYFWIGGRY